LELKRELQYMGAVTGPGAVTTESMIQKKAVSGEWRVERLFLQRATGFNRIVCPKGARRFLNDPGRYGNIDADHQVVAMPGHIIHGVEEQAGGLEFTDFGHPALEGGLRIRIRSEFLTP
jgi:hypothetical protein